MTNAPSGIAIRMSTINPAVNLLSRRASYVLDAEEVTRGESVLLAAGCSSTALASVP